MKTKLTALELEKVIQDQKDQQEIINLKAQDGDIMISARLLEQTIIQKQVAASNESHKLKSQLEAKYGEGFSIMEDGTVIPKEETPKSIEVLDQETQNNDQPQA